MKYSIKLTEEDFIKFNLTHLKISNMGKHTNRLIWAFTIAFVVISGILFFSIGDDSEYSIVVPIIETAFVAILMLIYMIFFKEKQFRKSIKRMIKIQKRDGKLPFAEKSTIEFGEEEIFECTENGTNHVKYEKLANVYFGDEEMYLYVDSQQAIIIPYSQLGEDREMVISFIKEKTNI